MSLIFDNISHTYGDSDVLTQVSLTAHAGEILCLLGPSGCGKTTLLNLAAGILKLQHGTITLDGMTLATSENSPPPEKRPVGLVFQEGALFPHLSVKDNIQFGIAKQPDRNVITAELLEQIGLSGFEQRFPHTLSGGQQQRIAVARALAPHPRVILMDEPFANIDITLRRRLREEIRQVLKAQNCITIMVTHDPEEAMEISDKLVVMLDGDVAQAGRPRDIYRAPNSTAVAKLTSEGRVVAARVSGDRLKTEFGDWPVSALSGEAALADKHLDLFIRPFSVHLELAKRIKGALKVLDVRHTGQTQIVSLLSAGGEALNVHVKTEPVWEAGQSVTLHPQTASLIGFSA